MLPLFSAINFKKIQSSIQTALVDCYRTVDYVVSVNKIVTWDAIYYPLMLAERKLQFFWSIISHLNSVKRNAELRTIYSESALSILEYKNWVNQHDGLYKSYKLLQTGDNYQKLNTLQKRCLKKILTNFRLSGINLITNQRKRYNDLIIILKKLSIEYNNNIFDSTLAWNKLITNRHLLSGIPNNRLKIANIDAKLNNKQGWLFTLQYTSYLSILMYCDSRELRKELYWAFHTRASDQGPNAKKWDNTVIMNDILLLRLELARILGFDNYLEKSLKTRMVKSPKQIFNFLINLSKHLSVDEQKKMAELQDFARKNYSCNHLMPWDIEYYREKKRQHFYFLNNEELRFYFPEKKVLDGMFLVANYIYGISIKECYNVDVWHPSVRFFNIFDNQSKFIGGFYLDIYCRDNKNEGAWMDELITLTYKKDNILYNSKPIAYLICNFSNNGIDPCLLTYDDVITLFHEFGHVLNHIMNYIDIDIPEISGINGLPWDVIELPSQLMEKFCWEPKVLRLISMHYKTGNPIPNYIFDNLLKLKSYQSSYSLLNQVIYGLFDLEIHYKYIPSQHDNISILLNEMKMKNSVFPVLPWVRVAHTFTHIFSDDYAAGYYSYLWSEMLALNIWYRMQKFDFLDVKFGQFFLDCNINSCINLDLFKKISQFCDCEITLQPMLKYYDIIVNDNVSTLI